MSRLLNGEGRMFAMLFGLLNWTLMCLVPGKKMSIDQEEDDKLRNRIRTFQDSASLLCADEKGTGPLRQRPGN